MKKVTVITVALFFLVSGTALAAGPVNPTTVCWIPPITNTDGSPLTDLGKHEVKIGINNAGPYDTYNLDVIAAVSTPTGTKECADVSELPLSDGQYYTVVRACDIVDNCGGVSNIVPFARNKVAPNPPTSYTAQ